MNDVIFLWKSREKPSDFKRWAIVWMKRSYHFITLLKILVRKQIVRKKGATVGVLTILGKSQFNGPLKRLQIGNHTSLGCCKIHLHDKVKIGNNVTINDGVEILSGTHRLSDPEWKLKTAPITIEDYAWIAMNAIILPGVRIGKGAVVGAGAVVRESVPDFAVVIGNPALLSNVKRTEKLDFSPVLFNAPFEAWVGRNTNINRNL